MGKRRHSLDKREKKSKKQKIEFVDIEFAPREEERSSIERKGLPNIGNTCYMNTALQVFVNIPCISKYFLVENKLRNGSFCKIIAEFIKAYWSNEVNGHDMKLRLSEIKNYVTSKTKQFEGYDQQDSNEFFLYLLDIIHNETKQCVIDTRPDMSEISGDDDLFESIYIKHGKTLWDTYLKYHNSIITENFYYMLYTKQRCLENETHLAVKFDVFSCITLPIPSGDTRVTLHDCFRAFMSSVVEECYCSHCKKKSKSDTKTCFLNLPDVLFLQLKRFKYDFFRKYKDTTMVDFPHEMDLKQYVDDKDNVSWNYRLIAFSDHVGSLEGGHYTAYIKAIRSKESKWCYFSDNYKEEVSIKEKPSNTVFYLIYKREKPEKCL